MSKTFLILGGYGNTGKLISEFLLKYTDSKLILAGRSLHRAEKVAHLLNEKYFDDRVSALRVNIDDKKNLSEKFQISDMIIVASSSINQIKNIAEAAVNAEIDYLDIQMSSSQKLAELQHFNDQIIEKELLFITDSGFHPGIPAILVRYAAKHFDKIEIANVGSLIRSNWRDIELSDSTIPEMVNEFKHYEALAFRDDKWQKISSRNYVKFDFDEEFKGQTCMPMMLEEMRELPLKYNTLRQCGFYVSGFNKVVDYLIIPVGYIGMKVAPKVTIKPFSKAFGWGLKKFCKPPFKTIIILSAVGRRNNLTRELKIKLSHSDAYWLTAASVTGLLFQYLRGNFNKPGIYLQGHLVEPVTFLKDIETLGVHVSINH